MPKKLLGRKKKRENIQDINEIENENEHENENKTIMRIIYLGKINNKKYDNNKYTYIKFSFSEKINLIDLPNKIIKTVKFNISSEKLWIIDKVEIGNTKEKKAFLLSIYINKVNTFYIDLFPNKKAYFFEFIFYSKTIKELPKIFASPYTQIIDKFDSYGLKYRKRICFINVDSFISRDYMNGSHLDPNSYKICVRIKKNGIKSSVVHELKLEKKLSIQKSKIKANENDILNILELFKDIKNKKSFKYIEKTYKNLSNPDEVRNFIKGYECADKHYSDIPNIDDNDANIFKEYLLKLIINYFFVGSKESFEKSRKNIIKIINHFEGIITDIEFISAPSGNRPSFRYRLYRSTFYNIYSIIKDLPSNKETRLQVLSHYNQEIIDLKKVTIDDPYFKAIKFLKEIAKNLDEKSSLFDILMQYNSGISNDIILSNKKGNKNRENISKYELSMITVDEVKNHLVKIIPDFLVKYTYNNDIYAFYSNYNDIVFINELKTFHINEITDEYPSYGYTLPLVILLIHEVWGHRKVSLSSKGRNSPSRISLRNEDFVENKLEILYGKKRKKTKGESGYEIEFLLTGKRYIKNIYSNYLLSDDENNENLLDKNLWIKPDFKDLRNLIIENIANCSPEEINKYISKNKEGNDEEQNICIMETYLIDDKEIGPFFKP
jgi:hypothetical protein